MAEPCVFCAMIAREIPVSQILHEDDAVIVFLDIKPRAPGHTVIVPKRHIETMIDLTDTEGRDLMKVARHIDRALIVGINAEGMTIGINQGTVAGQLVPHLHMHLIPRFAGDGGTSIHGVVDHPPEESLESIGNKIRACIGREDIVH